MEGNAPSNINRDKIRRWTAHLSEGDLALLRDAIDFIDGDSEFKAALLAQLDRAHDHQRVTRLRPTVKRLGEAEIEWLCENPEATRSFRR